MTTATQKDGTAKGCIKQCKLDPASDTCLGCGRTMTEIKSAYKMARLQISTDKPMERMENKNVRRNR